MASSSRFRFIDAPAVKGERHDAVLPIELGDLVRNGVRIDGRSDRRNEYEFRPRGVEGEHPPIKEGTNADLTCGRKPRVLHRDGTCLNSDAGATHTATRRACSLACNNSATHASIDVPAPVWAR